ncbi:hypothetical protein P4B35_23800, partial [Pontiellaceae bacterium B12227]|nr:hypothetical protein [Pontiellaceae bacterium B12227]
RDGRAMAGWAGDAVGVGVSRNHATTAAPPDRHSTKWKDQEEGAGAGAFLAYAESVTAMGQGGKAKPRGKRAPRRGLPPLPMIGKSDGGFGQCECASLATAGTPE